MKMNNLTDLLDGFVEIEQAGQNQKIELKGIEIPIIQRDYAQGRENAKAIRVRFLESIFSHLENDKVLEMDFVYGSIQKVKNGTESQNVFLPLDGQQRLTTLFLLYWFIGHAELEGEDLQELKKKLLNFSYSTRSTARTFCEKLATIGFDNNVVEEIKSAYWFHQNYEKDPTVMGMLNMLEAIQQAYNLNGKSDLYPKLRNLCFYILPLDGFDLTDELYIKMNARGKSLTDFENFKADLINWMKSDKNPEKESFEELVTLGSTEVPWNLAIASNFDNKWTDLFWEEAKKNEKEETKIVDHYFMRFLNRFFLNQYILSTNEVADKIEKSEGFKYFYLEDNEGGFKYDSFNNYSQLISAESLKNLEKVFNQLCKHKEEVKSLIKPSWDIKDNWELYAESINQRQRIVFYATTVFLENNEFDRDNFSAWMRVVWNFIIDPNIRNVPAMITAMRFVKQLSKHSNDIEDFISTIDFPLFKSNVTFLDQIQQEHKKAILIKQDAQWKNEIVKAEAHKLFRGNINFLLSDNITTSINQFTKYRDCSFELFHENTLTDIPQNYLWIRALLAKTIDVEEKLPLTLSNGNFNNWCILINGIFQNSMRNLLKDLLKREGSINDALVKVCKDYEINSNPAWLHPLVSWEGEEGETLLGDYSESRRVLKYDYYGIEDEHVFLYNKTKWTEGNINLSSSRNKVVSKLLAFSSDILLRDEWCSIHKKFFKGRNIILVRNSNNISFTYEVKSSKIIVGVELTPSFTNHFTSYDITEIQIENGWVFRQEYVFGAKNDLEIEKLFKTIESEIFDLNNSKSEINKILNVQ